MHHLLPEVGPHEIVKRTTTRETKKGGKVSSLARRTAGLGIQVVTRPCSCSASSSTLIGGSGAGWEGTATLHHGSYVKIGCLQFVFSVVNRAEKMEVDNRTTKNVKNELV